MLLSEDLLESALTIHEICTYSASTPVEVIVIHPFNLTQPANATEFIPEPLTVPGQNIAISILHEVGQGAQFDTLPL